MGERFPQNFGQLTRRAPRPERCPRPAGRGSREGAGQTPGVGLRSYNTQLCNKDADLINAEGDRKDAFEEEKTGLHVHFLAVKSAVQAQYGYSSTQYIQVIVIEWQGRLSPRQKEE